MTDLTFWLKVFGIYLLQPFRVWFDTNPWKFFCTSIRRSQGGCELSLGKRVGNLSYKELAFCFTHLSSSLLHCCRSTKLLKWFSVVSTTLQLGVAYIVMQNRYDRNSSTPWYNIIMPTIIMIYFIKQLTILIYIYQT